MVNMTTVSGIDKIAAMFARANEQGRPAFLLPFFTIGYPTYDQSIETILTLAEVGADGFEIDAI